jgi:hypothetical protein
MLKLKLAGILLSLMFDLPSCSIVDHYFSSSFFDNISRMKVHTVETIESCLHEVCSSFEPRENTTVFVCLCLGRSTT